MRRLLKMIALAVVLLLAIPNASVAGPVTSTLGRYSTGGAGLGALLGAGAATIPYVQEGGRSFDFVVGAGIGILVGAGVGLIFGIIDLSTGEPESQEKAAPVTGLDTEARLMIYQLSRGTSMAKVASDPMLMSWSLRF